jgi:hypothetical protein
MVAGESNAELLLLELVKMISNGIGGKNNSSTVSATGHCKQQELC